jgi:hypothetical protein
MTYSLAAAAAATGTDESTILKAIEGGKIAATKDELGEWHVEPAELHRVYPPVTEHGSNSDAARRAAAADTSDIEEQIAALIRQAGDHLRQQLDDVQHRDSDTWHDQPQASQQPLSDKRDRHPWWRRIAG